jgi:hypothetical protein
VDVAGAKKHLSDARDTLSQLTSMPEAAKLQGDARTQIAQLITNFNELITTQTDWRASYSKVDANLVAVLGPDVPADQPVGTAGSAAAAPATAGMQIDPGLRAKLVEFRTHLKAFQSAAGGPAAEAAAGATGGAMPPGAATATTSNPANPTAGAPTSANPTQPDPARPTGTSGVTAAPPAPAPASAPNAGIQKELDAISSILSASQTGALTAAETAQLKKHVEALRALIK